VYARWYRRIRLRDFLVFDYLKDTMSKGERVEDLTQSFATLEIEEDWTPTEDYYIHIDVLKECSNKVARAINKFMIQSDAFDPRRADNFPTDLMEESDKDTLMLRRELACDRSGSYYEFWKVRKDFSLRKFSEMVSTLPRGVEVRVVRVIDNDNEITFYKS